MIQRACLASLLIAAVAACGKSEPKGSATSGGSAPGPGTAEADVPRPPPPPPQPLPPLAADPGGATGAVARAVALGGPATDTIRAVAVAGDGAVVTGFFEGDAMLTPYQVTSAGRSDAFVARLSKDGAVAWVATLGGPNDDTGNAVAVSPDGTIAFGGLFSKTVAFGATKATAVGSDDLYVAAVGADGTPRWLWTAGGLDSDELTALVATPDGGFVAALSWGGKVDFGITTAVARGYDDAGLVKLSATGQVEWFTPVQGDGSEAIKRLAVDRNGTIYALGGFQQTLDLGGGPLTSAGAMDLLIARFDASGRHVWSKRVGNPWNEVAGGIAVDRAGGLVITGSFDRDVDFLGTPLVAGGESDVFVARLTGDGALVWVKRFGATREDIGYGVGVDDAGHAVVVGFFQSPIDFGGGPRKSKGQKDGFVARFDVEGKHLWSTRFGDWDDDYATSVAVAPDGTAWVAGLFRYQLDLISPPLTATPSGEPKVGKSDAFVARFER